MKYMLYHVGHRLWFHKYAYGLLILELAVSIGIFAAGLNLLFSNERILDSYRETLTKTKTVIYHNSTANRPQADGGSTDLPVRYEDYIALEEQFSDETVIYYAANYTASAGLFLYGKINEMHPVEFIFMNDDPQIFFAKKPSPCQNLAGLGHSGIYHLSGTKLMCSERFVKMMVPVSLGCSFAITSSKASRSWVKLSS